MTIAQIRDSEDSDDWQDAPWLDPKSVDYTNLALYGWQKFRVRPEGALSAPTESENAA